MNNRNRTSLAAVRYVAPGAAAAVSVGLFFNGFNNQFGPALSCIINSLLLAAMIGRRPPSAAFWRRVAPVIALVALATLWTAGLFGTGWSFTPDLLEGGILGIVAGLAALLAGCLFARRYECGPLLTWLLGIGAALLLFGLYLRQAGAGGDWDLWTATTSLGRFAGTLGNANVAAVYAAMLGLLAMAKALATLAPSIPPASPARDRALLLFFWLVTLLAVGTLVLSASRTTTIVFAAGACALLAKHFLPRRGGGGRVAAVAGTLALLGLGLGVFQFGLLEQRFGSIDAAFALRQTMWRHYANIALGSPLHGYGLGSFPSVNTYFLGDPALAQALWSVNSAHNIALQLAIEGGIPYLALLTLAAVWVGISVIRSRSIRRFSTEEAGVLVALAVVFAGACVDIVLDVPAMVTLTLFLAGTLWGRRADPAHVGVVAPELAPA